MKYVYKIVAAVVALAVIVAAIFLPLVYISFESFIPSVLLTIGSYLKNDTATEIIQNSNGELPTGVAENIAVKDFLLPGSGSVAEIIANIDIGDSDTATKALEPVISPAITLLVIFALILICAIVTAVIAIVVKDNRKVIYSAITGIGLSLMLPEAFEAVAAPFLNGDITLATLSGSPLASLLGSVAKVELSSTFWFIPIIFACVIVWTILYNITLPEEEKRERKLMLGEAE